MSKGCECQERRADGTFGATVVDTTTRFFRHVKKTAACWLWMGRLNRGGYGEFRMGGRLMNAHRAAVLLADGAIQPGAVVMHRCDNRRCVRRDHLETGSQSDNMRDCWRKGRGKSTILGGRVPAKGAA